MNLLFFCVCYCTRTLYLSNMVMVPINTVLGILVDVFRFELVTDDMFTQQQLQLQYTESMDKLLERLMFWISELYYQDCKHQQSALVMVNAMLQGNNASDTEIVWLVWESSLVNSQFVLSLCPLNLLIHMKK